VTIWGVPTFVNAAVVELPKIDGMEVPNDVAYAPPPAANADCTLPKRARPEAAKLESTLNATVKVIAMVVDPVALFTSTLKISGVGWTLLMPLTIV
jgi:hypothetical protein